MASQIVLEYFPTRGRAEYIVLILEEAGVPYERRNMIDRSNLKVDKDAYPFGQVPRLIDGSLNLVQGYTICRHLARKFNLYGSTLEEHAKADEIADAGEDLRSQYYEAIYTSGDFDAEVRAFAASSPGILAGLEYLLSKNNGGHGYFVGAGVTYADFIIFEMLDIIPKLLPNHLDAYPLLKAFHARVAARPKIAAYIASGKRPQVNGNNRGN